MKFVIGFAVLIALTILKGFVLVQLWRWFATPLFGLPEISIAGAIGVSCIVSLLTFPPRRKADLGDYDMLAAVIYSLSTTLFILLFGLVASGFVP